MKTSLHRLVKLQPKFWTSVPRDTNRRDRKIKKIMRFLHRSDDLETSVLVAVENILSDTPRRKVIQYQMSDVIDIFHALPPVQTVLNADFFDHATLPFRIFRRCLDLQIMNLINEERTKPIPFPDNDSQGYQTRGARMFPAIAWVSSAGITEFLNKNRYSKTVMWNPSAEANTRSILNESHPEKLSYLNGTRCSYVTPKPQR